MSESMNRHIRREAITNGITNCVFNGVIAWFLIKHRDSIPVWGGQGLAVDFFATGLILLFIVSLIIIPLARRKLRQGVLQPLVWQPGRYAGFLAFMSRRHLALCALMLGLIGACVFVPPMLLLLELAQVSALSPAQFAVTKGLWAGVLAGLMVPPMLCIATYSGVDTSLGKNTVN